MESDSGGLVVFRDHLVVAGVCVALYGAGLVVAGRSWWRGGGDDADDGAGLPLAVAALAAAALLAWCAAGLVTGFVPGDVGEALLLAEAWGSGWTAAALLLAAYFHAEAVGFFGVTGVRGKAAESTALAAGALLLGRAGVWAAGQLGLAGAGAAGRLAAAWCAASAVARARRAGGGGRGAAWAAGAVAATVVARTWPAVWHVLAAAGAMMGRERASGEGGGTPLLCLRAARAMLVAGSGHAGGGGGWMAADSVVFVVSLTWHWWRRGGTKL